MYLGKRGGEIRGQLKLMKICIKIKNKNTKIIIDYQESQRYTKISLLTHETDKNSDLENTLLAKL